MDKALMRSIPKESIGNNTINKPSFTMLSPSDTGWLATIGATAGQACRKTTYCQIGELRSRVIVQAVGTKLAVAIPNVKTMEAILKIENLRVEYRRQGIGHKPKLAVKGLNLQV